MSEVDGIRVMIVDDQAAVRSGLAAFLYAFDDLVLAGEAAGGEEAVRLCMRQQPDVVLMDLLMPIMDGAEATSVIKQRFPDVQVVALTSFPEEDLVRKAFEAGVTGYLLKNTSADDLACAIRAAHAERRTTVCDAATPRSHEADVEIPYSGGIVESAPATCGNALVAACEAIEMSWALLSMA